MAIITGGEGFNRLFGSDGNDTLISGSGINYLFADLGDDTYEINTDKFYIVDLGGEDTAIVNVDFAKITAGIETVIYADGVKKLPYWVSALVGPHANIYSHWLDNGKYMEFAFPRSNNDFETILDYYLPVKAISGNTELKGFRAFSESQKAATRSILDYVESLVNITFFERTNVAKDNVIAFVNSEQEISEQQISGAIAFMPALGTYIGSDIFISIKSDGSLRVPLDGSVDAEVFMHEIGHALGLSHPFENVNRKPGETGPGPFLKGDEENKKWTQMSYTGSVEKATFSELDIAALQFIYGPNPESRAEDDTYIYDESNMNLIWDGAGLDTIDASTATDSVTIFLKPGYLGFKGLIQQSELITSPGQITVNFGTEIENLIGSNFSDVLTGNELNNTLIGGKGDDKIDGDAGIDTVSYTVNYDDVKLDNFIDYGSDGSNIQLGTAWNVSIDSDVDTLRNIERLKFNDTNIAIDIEGNAGKTVRLLSTLLGSEAASDKKNIGFGLSALDGGMSYEALMKAGLDIVLGANPSGASVVDLLYKNLVGSTAPQSILDEYGSMIDSGSMTATSLGIAVADHSMTATNIDLVGLAQTGIEYTLVV